MEVLQQVMDESKLDRLVNLYDEVEALSAQARKEGLVSLARALRIVAAASLMGLENDTARALLPVAEEALSHFKRLFDKDQQGSLFPREV